MTPSPLRGEGWVRGSSTRVRGRYRATDVRSTGSPPHPALSPEGRGIPLLDLTPGGSADMLVRRMAEPLARDLGQPVVVDNRPGAGGIIGMEAVAKAPPDRHMVGLTAAGPAAIHVALGA